MNSSWRSAIPWLVLLGACRVDEIDLEGRRCPCAAGWICETATDTCTRDPATIDAPELDAAAGDAGDAATDAVVIDAVDAPPGSSCLGGAPGASLFADDFPDLIGWVTSGGSWSAGGEAVQASSAAARTYAYPAGTDSFTDYRIEVRARRIAGAGTLAIALRVQGGSDGRYLCAWEPTTGALRAQWVRTNGSIGGTLASAQVDIGSIAGYDPDAPVVAEAQAVGAQLTCCVRDLPGGMLTTSDNRYAAGAPGLGTDLLSAGFDDLAVNAP